MQELVTVKAETVVGDPSADKVYLFVSALWSTSTSPEAMLHAMRPAFSAGGFILPPHRRSKMLIVDANVPLPPCGGYMEDAGRNRYIDGCSASLLVMPPRRGDPCVVHMHILPGTAQSEHHHPSERTGLVVRGLGLAHHEAGPPMVLYPGKAWRIPAGETHHFETGAAALDVLVFHADSAWGPTDKAYRMLDATIM